MNVSDIQMLLAAGGFHAGAIDGDPGTKTMAAVAQLELKHASHYRGAPQGWSQARRLIAAGQAMLAQLGHEPGTIDGYAGHNTAEALTAWRNVKAGVFPVVAREVEKGARSHPAQRDYPRQRDMRAFYGAPGGADCTAGKVDLAYPMLIAWNKAQVVWRFSCHARLAQPLTAIFRETLQHYGRDRITALNLDIFGGCYNFRNQRGGDSLSTHAYGAAVDLNPEANQLRWGADRAQFARVEYEPFWNIVMAHGGTPAGYAWGKDWMHFQFARL